MKFQIIWLMLATISFSASSSVLCMDRTNSNNNSNNNNVTNTAQAQDYRSYTNNRSPYDEKKLENLISEIIFKIHQELVEKNYLEQSSNNNYVLNPTYCSKNQQKAEYFERFLQSTVYDIVATTDLSPVCIKPTNSCVQNLSEMLTRTITQIFSEVFSDETSLDWCACFAITKRIALVVHVVESIKQQHSPDKLLVYTSVGSGRLLQDYLILNELQTQGYQSIDVHLIEPGYFEPTELSIVKKHMQLSHIHPHNLMEFFEGDNRTLFAHVLENFFEPSLVGAKIASTASLLHFKEKLQALTFREHNQPGILVTTHNSMRDYIEWVETNSSKKVSEKTDVLLMIDPSSGFFPAHPGQADLVIVELRDPKKHNPAALCPFNDVPSFMIFLPRHQGIRIYTNNNHEKFIEHKKQADAIFKELAALIKKTGAASKFSRTLIKELALYAENRRDIHLKFVSDTYVAFQDMLWDTLKNPKQAVVYILDSGVTAKINPELYKGTNPVNNTIREDLPKKFKDVTDQI